LPVRVPPGQLRLLLAGASLAAAGHSLARLGRAGRRRHRLGPEDSGETVSVSVVVPARDEAARIEGCLAALATQDLAPLELVVVDDGSRDATAALARRAGARVVAAPPPPAGVAGKAAACALGAAEARAGAWLAFVDADVRLAPEALSRLAGAAVAAGAVAAGPLARMLAGTWWEELLLPELGLQVAERLDLDALADRARPDAFLSGQCLLVRRDAYEAVGGFAAVAGSLVEDVALARRLKAAGYGLCLRLAPGLAQVRMYERPDELWRGLARNLAEVWGDGAGAVARQAARALLATAPWAALAATARRGDRAGAAALAAAGLAHLVVRAGGRCRAGADPRYALAYPLADAVLLAVYGDSVLRRRLGRPVTWKGRRYQPQGNL
jgi:glycosyltransferase involved in cell wall biosynthesis